MREAYELSKQFAPPSVDLRMGRLLDDHGDAQNATVSLTHRDPYDVTSRQLEYYYDVWGFLSGNDILFYLFPVIRFLDSANEPPVYFDRWLAAMAFRLDDIVGILNNSQAERLRLVLAASILPSELDAYPVIREFCRSDAIGLGEP